MLNNNKPIPRLYLAANEQMQLHLTCVRLMDYAEDEFAFATQATALVEIESSYAREIPFQLISYVSKSGLGTEHEVDMPHIDNVSIQQLDAIATLIQQSPQYAQLLLDRLTEIQQGDDAREAVQAQLAKDDFLDQLQDRITHFSTNRGATKLFWIYKNDRHVSNVSPFMVDERGGRFSFSVHCGFSNGLLIQSYDVECMMHLFNDGDKLGYYFELFLDEDNFHHQIMYRELPEKFMNNKRFLNRTLQLMKQCQNEQYKDYLEDLIVKFKAGIL